MPPPRPPALSSIASSSECTYRGVHFFEGPFTTLPHVTVTLFTHQLLQHPHQGGILPLGQQVDGLYPDARILIVLQPVAERLADLRLRRHSLQSLQRLNSHARNVIGPHCCHQRTPDTGPGGVPL